MVFCMRFFENCSFCLLRIPFVGVFLFLRYLFNSYELLFMLMQPEVIERHFHDLIQRYGSVVVVDLLNQVIVKYSFLIVDVKYMLG